MVFRAHGFFFMIFAGRNYLELSFSIGYDDWSEDFAVHITIPFLMLSFGYEFNQMELLANRQEDMENDE